MLFQTGGFPIAQNGRHVEQEITEDGASLQGEMGQACIRLLAGQALPFICRKRGVNPAGEFSSVPCLRGTFGDNKGIVVIAVWAVEKAGSFELPLVTVNKQTCTLKWRDREQQIVLD